MTQMTKCAHASHTTPDRITIRVAWSILFAGAQAGAHTPGIGKPTSSTSMAGTPIMITVRRVTARTARSRSRRGTSG